MQQRQADHIARIKSMTEEQKDRLYKQMIKDREDDKRDYILMYGFEKWEQYERYKKRTIQDKEDRMKEHMKRERGVA